MISSQTETGPRYSDAGFFKEQLNLRFPGMEEVAAAVAAEDYPAARKAYAAYIRSHLQPERYFCIPYDGPGNCIVLEGESEQESADRICRNRLVSCGIPHDFGSTVDWYQNPTPNEYSEWTWQLSRHNEWKLLAHAYQQTGDERYAEKCADFFTSWVRQARYPGPMPKGWSICWRTIECGIRMGINWPYALHAFYKSPSFTDDLLVDWAKSVCEHGHLLHDQHKQGNWLIMEMNGLAQLSIVFPELTHARQWLTFALELLEKELHRQLYPDGFQYELSTNYHEVVLSNYCQLIRIARSYDIAIPESFLSVLEHASEVNLKLMQPNGRLPDLNDGSSSLAADFIRPKMALFGHRTEFQWLVSDGKEGVKPDYASIALPYSGIMIMRSSWQSDAVWALLDAGPFGHGHQHEDKLNLLLSAHGKPLLIEGDNYAYDDSEMRQYVLSTRAHNTIRVDGQDQNRKRDYHWEEQDITRLSDMGYRIEDDFDFAEGSYAEGYAAVEDESIVHRRSVYFLKKPAEGLKPFLLVVDRLTADTEHTYEILWHLDSDEVSISGGRADMDGLRLLWTDNVRQGLVIHGQTQPEWQGWAANSFTPGDYRPVCTLQCSSQGKQLRIVTLLDPYLQAEQICASADPKETAVTLCLASGRRLVLDEQDYRT